MFIEQATRIFRLFVVLSFLALFVGCGGGGGGGGDTKGDTPGAEETNANISSIEFSSGAITFEPDTTAYNVEVANSVSTFSLTLALANEKASCVINGTSVESGVPFNLSLSIGTNTIQIVVTAEDGSTTKTYTIVVTRISGVSQNCDLSDLVLSQGTLNPSFDANTTAYTTEVDNGTAALTVTPTAAGVNASITVDGTSVASETSSASIPLSIGTNIITLVVTAEDGTTTKTYTLVVTRLAAEPSHDANLANLTISQGVLTPSFLSNTISYTAQVNNSVATLTVTPIAAGVNASITVNGNAVASGSPAQAINLNVGSNTITTVVTAEDGATIKTYTLVMTRLAAQVSHNANLANISLSTGDTIHPSFSYSNTTYLSDINEDVISLTITPTAVDSNATITVNGYEVISGTASQLINITSDPYIITIVVTAQDTITTKTYSVSLSHEIFIGSWTWVYGDNGDPQYNHLSVYGIKGVAAATNKPGTRYESVSWVDANDNFWLFGGEMIFGSSSSYLNDLWKFDGTNWTWVSGDNTFNQSAVYGVKGFAAPGNKPGARGDSISWIDSSGNLWLFGGNNENNIGCFNDLWKFDGVNWIWLSGDSTTNQNGVYGSKGISTITNKPGSRHRSISWIDSSDNLWLFGGIGYDSIGIYANRLNDLWKFDGMNWTWVSGDNITGQGGVYGTRGVAAPGNKPGARCDSISWIDSRGNLWLFGGIGDDSIGNSGPLNDLWKFDGTNWTWVSGDNIRCQGGVYGTKGVAAPGNKPGARGDSISWIDSSGNLWLFGGSGYDSVEDQGHLNDLWMFDGMNWTWVSGDRFKNQSSTYGTKGIGAATNKPGGRYGGVSWIDSNDNLWLMGGFGLVRTNTYGLIGGDLWKFEP